MLLLIYPKQHSSETIHASDYLNRFAPAPCTETGFRVKIEISRNGYRGDDDSHPFETAESILPPFQIQECHFIDTYIDLWDLYLGPDCYEGFQFVLTPRSQETWAPDWQQATYWYYLGACKAGFIRNDIESLIVGYLGTEIYGHDGKNTCLNLFIAGMNCLTDYNYIRPRYLSNESSSLVAAVASDVYVTFAENSDQSLPFPTRPLGDDLLSSPYKVVPNYENQAPLPQHDGLLVGANQKMLKSAKRRQRLARRLQSLSSANSVAPNTST